MQPTYFKGNKFLVTCCECYYCPTCSSEEFNSLIGKQVDISDDSACKAFVDRRLSPFRQMYLNICYPGREEYLKENKDLPFFI